MLHSEGVLPVVAEWRLVASLVDVGNCIVPQQQRVHLLREAPCLRDRFLLIDIAYRGFEVPHASRSRCASGVPPIGRRCLNIRSLVLFYVCWGDVPRKKSGNKIRSL